MSPRPRLRGDRAIGIALLSALLFGASTPLARLLLERADAWTLAGTLYLGSGLGLAAWRLLRRGQPVRLARGEAAWLAAAILCGGVLAPVLLLTGLAALPAASASLLLNAEGLFTALLAWIVFRENVDRRVAAGMFAIVAGAVVLSWPAQGGEWRFGVPALLVLAACLAWAVDNNLTRKVSAADASFIAMTKGLVAGGVNLAIAMASGSTWPDWPVFAAGAALGSVGYGLSLVLFVVALRHLGTARTGAYFSVAPFFGAALAVLLGENLDLRLVAAGALMAVGVWLHVTEHHEHVHAHEALDHDHEHAHDEHHEHEHDADAPPLDARGRHRHHHRHAALVHSHAHYPDLHHRHEH